MRVLNRSDVERLLTMTDCIRLMAEALEERDRGNAEQPLRNILRLPDGSGLMATMPACVGTPTSLGVKIVSIFPGNAQRGLDSHQGAVLLVDPTSGRLSAVLEAGSVTAIRTAAVSGVATDWLAREDADDLALIGAGLEARTHLQAINSVRSLRRIRVWNRTRERAERFAAEAASRGITIEVMDTARDAVRDASIICTTTAARDPVVEGAWIAAGAHINAVGSSIPTSRELDSALVRAATLFVDSKESALNEAGDLLIPMAERSIAPGKISAELGAVLTRKHPGRTRPDEITLFKSLGLGIEDVAAARFVVAEAERLGVGREVSLD